MNVASYIYQSPSPSAVQVGRLDPSSVKEEVKEESESSSFNTTTQVQKEAQVFEVSQIGEVTPSVESQHLLDVYA